MILQTKIIDDKNNVLKVLDHGRWCYPQGEVHKKPQAGFETLFEETDLPWAAVDFVYDDTGYEFPPYAFDVVYRDDEMCVMTVMLFDMKDLDDDWENNGRLLRWFPQH